MAAQPAPDFTLQHITGRKVSLNDFRGKPVVLIFGDRNTSEQVSKLEQDIRAKLTPDQLAVVSVADLHRVPRLMHGLAKRDIEKSYNKATQDAARELQAKGKVVPSDMSQVVILALELDGKTISAYGATNLDKQAVAVLIDSNGMVKARAEGSQAAEQIIGQLG